MSSAIENRLQAIIDKKEAMRLRMANLKKLVNVLVTHISQHPELNLDKLLLQQFQVLGRELVGMDSALVDLSTISIVNHFYCKPNKNSNLNIVYSLHNLSQEKPTTHPIPEYTSVYAKTAYGKEVVGVKWHDPKAETGFFLLYNYTDTYSFDQAAVKKAVRNCSH